MMISNCLVHIPFLHSFARKRETTDWSPLTTGGCEMTCLCDPAACCLSDASSDDFMPNRLFQPLPMHPCCLLTELLLVPGLVSSPNSTSK